VCDCRKGDFALRLNISMLRASFMQSKAGQADLIKLFGAMQLAPILDLADEIIDIVNTGNILKANGVEARDEIADISAQLIVNKVVMKIKFNELQSTVESLCSVV
jgi:ATP phosphoribosyltransferase